MGWWLPSLICKRYNLCNHTVGRGQTSRQHYFVCVCVCVCSFSNKPFGAVEEDRAVLVRPQRQSRGCSSLPLHGSRCASPVSAAWPRACLPAGLTLATNANVMDTLLWNQASLKTHPGRTKADSYSLPIPKPSSRVCITQRLHRPSCSYTLLN